MPKLKSEPNLVPIEQDKINDLINSSYEKGKLDGKQEVIVHVINSLNQKAAQLFLNRHDDLAKEIRGVALAISNELKEKS